MAEKAILDKHYGKKKKFTNAVNVMKKVVKNIDKEVEKTSKEDQQQLIAKFNQRTVKIVLKRLTQQEIDRYSRKTEKHTRKTLRSRKTENHPRMTLRSRKNVNK